MAIRKQVVSTIRERFPESARWFSENILGPAPSKVEVETRSIKEWADRERASASKTFDGKSYGHGLNDGDIVMGDIDCSEQRLLAELRGPTKLGQLIRRAIDY